MVQYELVREVKKLAQEQGNELGQNKIRQVLHKFDGIYWEARRGERNALEYSPLLLKTFSEEKKALFDYVEALLAEGVKEPRDIIKVGRFSFVSLDEIRNSIRELSDEEAKELLDKLRREFPEKDEVEEIPEF